MKLGPVTKFDKKNKKMSKKTGNDVMFKNYDAIAIFRIWGLFEAIRNLDTGRIVQKLKTELKISNATL